MSLDPPSYILQIQNNIRARPVSWEGAVRAKTITDGQLKQIKSIDKVRKEQRRQTIASDVKTYVQLFFGGDNVQSIFEAAAKREDIIQYSLVLVGDIIDDNQAFTEELLKHSDPYAPLLPFLKNVKEPASATPLLTSVTISSILSQSLGMNLKTSKAVEECIPKLQKYLSTLTDSADGSLQDIAVQQYSAVLRNSRSRELYWKQRSETLSPLIDILRSAVGNHAGSSASSTINGDTGSDATSTTLRPASSRASIRTSTSDSGLSGNVSIQLLYHVLLVVWQLSFSSSLVGHDLSSEHDIVPLYTSLIKISPKEKLTRLLLATLNNLFAEEKNQSIMLPAAASSRLGQLLGNLKGRHVTDDDLQEDLQALKKRLEDYASTQTTLSTYASELQSGHLRWSPPHKNAQFWTENARHIIENDKGELVKKLSQILGEKWENDKQVLAIGCNDVANLVKECPEKKSQLEKLGLKARVMELMASEDEVVRWEALRATGEWMRYNFQS